MTLRIAATAILVALFIWHCEGFQRRNVHDNSFSDNNDATRDTHDENGSGNDNNLYCVHVNSLVHTCRLVQ